jgi:LysM repeat protein
MEKRVAALDAATKKIDTVDGLIKGLQQSVSKVEGVQRGLVERIDKLAQQAERPAVAQAAPKKPTTPAKLHEVRPGETVFSIAKKYNLSSEQFLKLNNMTKKDTLQAGQKVVIAP